ncbi:Omega-amidase [Hexamita inflata]|uniref:Omega-amidase n=1 Tax=Hexamita inflata TaxID=28002 RepID=A0AA86NQ03_9EUKA|nr:Omega-amidase [Hexamita inflata]CAI9938960.1 Omega-amidase [Hexamita inflata]
MLLNEPGHNRLLIKSKILERPGFDLYVLPEYMTTGFVSDPTSCFETMEGATIAFLKDLSQSINAAICGTLIIKEDNDIFNRFVFINKQKVASYDKRHLFSPGNEHLKLSKPNKRVFVTYQNTKILLQICYDLRFPAFTHTYPDMIIWVANWPIQRITAWNTLLKARAIENQCFVIGCNRIGTDQGLVYEASSQVINYMGEAIVGEVIEAQLDFKGAAKFKEGFGAWRDADKVIIEGVEDVVIDMNE